MTGHPPAHGSPRQRQAKWWLGSDGRDPLRTEQPARRLGPCRGGKLGSVAARPAYPDRLGDSTGSGRRRRSDRRQGRPLSPRNATSVGEAAPVGSSRDNAGRQVKPGRGSRHPAGELAEGTSSRPAPAAETRSSAGKPGGALCLIHRWVRRGRTVPSAPQSQSRDRIRYTVT